MTRAEARGLLDDLTDEDVIATLYDWRNWRRPSQQVPPGDWLTWLLMTGRGFGKTRVGAEWTINGARDRDKGGAGCRRQALVHATPDDVRAVMIEGESGILACSPPDFYPHYEPTRRQLTWPNGAIAKCYSAETPGRPRGPAHDRAWVEELAAWKSHKKRTDLMDNLMLGLRLGNDPRCLITTTPQPIQILRDFVKDPTCVVTGGSTYENLQNLAPQFRARILSKFEGTSKGRQEILGQLLEELPGALWMRKWIDNNRVDEAPDLVKAAVAVDPSVTAKSGSSECGIIWGGRDRRKPPHFYVCGDLSELISADKWAKRAVDTYRTNSLDAIVYETNQGGDLVKLALRQAREGGNSLPITGVHASRGKRTRAEPVSMLYEQGRVHHVGSLPGLEDQLCTWVPGEDDSPDRLDALVWLIAYLSGAVSSSVSPVDTSAASKYAGR